jgi:hypothetical protein
MKLLESNNKEEIQVCSLDEVYIKWDSNMTPEIYKKIEAEIKENGMYSPILLLRMTPDEWRNDLKIVYNIPEGVKFINTIEYGSTRYRYAKENGYTHIHGVVFTMIETLRLYEKKLNKWYRDWITSRGTTSYLD